MKRFVGLGLVVSVSVAFASFACSSDPTVTDDAGTSPTGTGTGTVPPPGPACTTDSECDGGTCQNGACSNASRIDGVKNGDETDVDCGGKTAPRCGAGKACLQQSDCQSLPCTGGVCKKSSPDDGVQNNDETDVDCGGLAAKKCEDGKTCANGRDCASGVCRAFVCRAPTITDGVKNGDETYIDCGGTLAPACKAGESCAVARDCESGVCNQTTKACAPAYTTDGVKNGTETDIDCGGPSAPVCAAGKTCAVGGDCDSGFCSLDGGSLKCEPRKAGRKDGDETDVDCGGTVAPKCAAEKTCAADRDCASNACSSAKKCLEGPSCRPVIGGQTCGTGDVGGAGVAHESCCKSIQVPGYTDPRQPGKTVWLDKYEITSGRVRAFVAAVQAAQGSPNIKGYMAANRPARWVNGWENALPATAEGQTETFTVQNPTVDLLYPGQDRYLTNRTQTTWSVASGTFNFRPGLYFSLMTPGATFFPEYVTQAGVGWPTNDYAVTHNQNCSTTAGSYGYGTYYFPDAVAMQYTGGRRFFTQDQMDVKAINCVSFAMLTAFCAWDGGQLATQEVWDTVSGNGSRLGGAPSCANGINAGADGSNRCDGLQGRTLVYYYPPDGGNTYDGSARIAPPGRVPADEVIMPGAAEGWRDMKGNVMEAVLLPDNTFTYKGYGHGWSSVTHHRNQISTPRMMAGAFGARCMRFK